MKRLFNWQILLGISLIALSAVIYFIHYYIFRDAHHIFLYLIGDIAFVFIEVLMVTLVLHKLLNLREKKEMLNKLNMVIGAFFSEVGGELLRLFLGSDTKHDEIACKLLLKNETFEKDFLKITKSKIFFNNTFAIYNCLCDVIICVDILTSLVKQFPITAKKCMFLNLSNLISRNNGYRWTNKAGYSKTKFPNTSFNLENVNKYELINKALLNHIIRYVFHEIYARVL